MLTLDEIEQILNKPCLICGQLNRFHKVFYSPDKKYYVRQGIEEDWFGEKLVTGHWAIVDNLIYLEHLDEIRQRDA